MFDEPACGSHQVYLCHASRAVLEGGANKVPVSMRHPRRLCAWGGVADQAARQGASFDNACNAILNARRGIMRREVQLRDRTRARPYRASVGARGVARLSVCGGSLCGVVAGLVACVDLKYHRDRTRLTHQYSFRVGEVCKALRYDAVYFAVYRLPGFVKRERALGPSRGLILDICVDERAGSIAVGVRDAPPGPPTCHTHDTGPVRPELPG